MNKAAAIDIGSNTLRLLIANIEGNRLLPIIRDREIVRLGRNFYPERILSAEAMDLALRVLGRFRRQMEQERINNLRAAGTGVLREAQNSDGFIEAVRRETNLKLEIISGEEEAELSAWGVLSVFPRLSTRTFIFDLGGGSAEFVNLDGNRLETAVSLPLGVVGLTELFLPSDPPGPAEIKRLQAYVLEILMKNIQPAPALPRLIGTAGTVTTLAAMVQGLTDYDPDRINGSVLDRDTLDRLLSTMGSLPLERRSRLPGLEPGRSDIIVAGLAVVLTVMLFFKVAELWVSDAGLLEGLLLENPARR
ncbi:MAG: Ppx/GppA family phosphatase [Deltaproteobacteria bacterium]|nr:Ppx/GppA family phosphatase [Deltaproteobacteria bacterium]